VDGFSLADEALDWIEAAANDESPKTRAAQGPASGRASQQCGSGQGGRRDNGHVTASVMMRCVRGLGGRRSNVAVVRYCGVTFRSVVNGRAHGRID